MQDLTALVGRILLVGLFLLGGWDKVNGLDGTANYIASKNLPMPQVLAMVSAAVELIGAILIVIGFKTRLAALALGAFALAASLIFHDYWNVAPPGQMAQYLFFTKNIGILGGLLVLAAFGPGRYSVDGRSSYA